MSQHVRKGREALNRRRKSALIRTKNALAFCETQERTPGIVATIHHHNVAIKSLEARIY